MFKLNLPTQEKLTFSIKLLYIFSNLDIWTYLVKFSYFKES